MGKKSIALGRGLDQILKSHDTSEFEKNEGSNALKIQSIPLHLIDPNPFQPRKTFNEEEIAELAESIKNQGMIQPITVRKYDGRYQIVTGERRTRAARLAGLETIDSYVHDLLSDKKMNEWALIENIQRIDLNPIEIAESYQQLINNFDYTHDDLAKSIGKSRSAITNSIRLLNLPEQVKSWVREGKLSSGAARSLLSPEIENPEEIAQQIIENGLNVREVEKLTKKNKTATDSTKKISEKPELDPDMMKFEQRLKEFFGTKVALSPSAKNHSEGTIIIHYYSMDDLARFQEIMDRP